MSTKSEIKKTALYYPEIAIPSANWIRQAVLYYDELASIVPANIELWTEYQRSKRRDGQTPEFEIISEDLRTLMDEGQYRQISPESLLAQVRDEFNSEFLAALYSSPFQTSLGLRTGWVFDAAVHVRKGTPDLFSLLASEGYIKQDPKNTSWYNFETSTSLLYMSILAKYLARADRNDTVPSSSKEGRSIHDIVLGSNFGTTTCVADLLFQNVLPCPAPTTSITQILGFKKKRQSELLTFRSYLAELEKSLSAAESIENIKSILSDFQDQKAKAIVDLGRSFEDAKFEIVLQSLESLVQIRSPTLWLTAAALAGKIDVASLPIHTIAIGVAFTGLVQVTVKATMGIKKQIEANRSSSFAYIHHVESRL